jgi:hypothetical protein
MLPLPPLSTGPTALRAHRRGVAHMLQGRPRAAVHHLSAAVHEDPCFVVGHADLALAEMETGGPRQHSLETARSCSRTLSRYERHHAEVVALALDGQIRRATALAMEHLADYPDDEVVRYLLDRWRGEEPG